jgi:Virulence protein
MNEMVPNQQNLIIYNTLDGKVSVTMMARDGNVWMNQKQMAELFATSKQNVGQHISNILKENELTLDSVVKNFFITAADGKQYDVTFYSLDMVLAVGFRVKGKRGTQFRIWANQHLKEFIVKGFVLDDERLKNPDGRPDYFDELLERIRDIRASEKRFYQKLRDLFALSSDYDSTDKATQMFLPKRKTSCFMPLPTKPLLKSSSAVLMPRSLTWHSHRGKDLWYANRTSTSPRIIFVLMR